MLNLIPGVWDGIDYTFLEPACGDGNFLAAILQRKISAISEEAVGGTEHWYEFALLRCVASIYGIDISNENVQEARARMQQIMARAVTSYEKAETSAFALASKTIIEGNVVLGDSLNGPAKIIFTEYEPLAGERFGRTQSHLESPEMDLFFMPPAELPTIHYSQLAAG